MGRHETFENATLIADELLAGTMLGRAPTGALPEPGSGDAELLALSKDWEAAAAAYDQAIRDQRTITDRADTIEAPPPREPYAEWARLVPGWRERTGVEAVEAASSDALDDLCEIEDRISNMPATTLAGLKLKARVAQRNEEVSWPEGLEESLVRDILAIGEPEIAVDADLLRLGRQFEAARAREIAACGACNAAQCEANRHMPERPPSLIYRASDEALNVHQNWMMPEALEGREVHYQDVVWLRRKMPMTHEVLRPIRAGERENSDHPGQRHETVPYPEAQVRAEEIVTAWDAWRAEQDRIQDKYVTPELEDAAVTAGEAAADIAEQIARLPARTAVGFRVKLLALSHYRPKALLVELPDEPDPDQILSHSLWRDVQDDTASAAEPVDWHNPPPGFMASPAIEPMNFARIDHAIGLELDRLHGIAVAEFKRLGGPTKSVEDQATLRQRLHLDTLDRWPPREAERHESATVHSEPSLIGMLDLASASLEDLQSLHDTADLVSSVAYSACWQSRCHARGWSERNGTGDHYNVAGKLMQWLGDALNNVESAAYDEAKRRLPVISDDRETRLKILALPVIRNGDPDETEAFARELLAHAEAERQGR